MPKVRTRLLERIRVAEYSHVEYEAEVEGEYDSKEKGLEENQRVLAAHFKQFRKEIKKAFRNGEFDLTD